MAKAKKDESKEVAAWQTAMQESAKKVAQNEGTDSSAITLQHGRMMYHEQEVPDNELEVVVVASVTERCYYDGPYDADKITSPACFAQSTDPKEMFPHENVLEPQADNCQECPMAEFGSAKVGRGPACKTYRKIIMVPSNTPAEDMPRAELAYMKISPTSVKNWSKYANGLVSQYGIPPWAARTKIKLVPDKKTIWQILFSGIDRIEDQELLAAIHARIEGAEEKLMQPYTYDEEEEEKDSTRY